MRRALIVVDVQPTFCEGGSLPVPGGNACAQRIRDFLLSIGMGTSTPPAGPSLYEVYVASQDWHISPGDHFSATPDFVDSWPPHAQAGTNEAELHPLLGDLPWDVRVRKGMYAAAYSAFEGTTGDEAPSPATHSSDHPAPSGLTLHEALQARGITDVDVVGLAQSHCVCATAVDARHLGYGVRVLTDLTEPVSADLGKVAEQTMREAGVQLLTSRVVLRL